jgi:hypothetical protein
VINKKMYQNKYIIEQIQEFGHGPKPNKLKPKKKILKRDGFGGNENLMSQRNNDRIMGPNRLSAIDKNIQKFRSLSAQPSFVPDKVQISNYIYSKPSEPYTYNFQVKQNMNIPRPNDSFMSGGTLFGKDVPWSGGLNADKVSPEFLTPNHGPNKKRAKMSPYPGKRHMIREAKFMQEQQGYLNLPQRKGYAFRGLKKMTPQKTGHDSGLYYSAHKPSVHRHNPLQEFYDSPFGHEADEEKEADRRPFEVSSHVKKMIGSLLPEEEKDAYKNSDTPSNKFGFQNRLSAFLGSA